MNIQSDNSISDEGMIALSEALVVNKYLKVPFYYNSKIFLSNFSLIDKTYFPLSTGN